MYIGLFTRPAVVDEDYREPYNIWRETLGRREKRESHDQNEYNGKIGFISKLANRPASLGISLGKIYSI